MGKPTRDGWAEVPTCPCDVPDPARGGAHCRRCGWLVVRPAYTFTVVGTRICSAWQCEEPAHPRFGECESHLFSGIVTTCIVDGCDGIGMSWEGKCIEHGGTSAWEDIRGIKAP